MIGHDRAPEHLSIRMLCKYLLRQSCLGLETDRSGSKRVEQYLERSISDSTSIWQEVEDSFVSNIVGGKGQPGPRL